MAIDPNLPMPPVPRIPVDIDVNAAVADSNLGTNGPDVVLPDNPNINLYPVDPSFYEPPDYLPPSEPEQCDPCEANKLLIEWVTSQKGFDINDRLETIETTVSNLMVAISTLIADKVNYVETGINNCGSCALSNINDLIVAVENGVVNTLDNLTGYIDTKLAPIESYVYSIVSVLTQSIDNLQNELSIVREDISSLQTSSADISVNEFNSQLVSLQQTESSLLSSIQDEILLLQNYVGIANGNPTEVNVNVNPSITNDINVAGSTAIANSSSSSNSSSTATTSANLSINANQSQLLYWLGYGSYGGSIDSLQIIIQNPGNPIPIGVSFGPYFSISDAQTAITNVNQFNISNSNTLNNNVVITTTNSLIGGNNYCGDVTVNVGSTNVDVKTGNQTVTVNDDTIGYKKEPPADGGPVDVIDDVSLSDTLDAEPELHFDCSDKAYNSVQNFGGLIGVPVMSMSECGEHVDRIRTYLTRGE